MFSYLLSFCRYSYPSTSGLFNCSKSCEIIQILSFRSFDDIGGNYWNVTKDCLNPSIIGGPCTGGNWYADYTGIDLDGDWIGDTSDYSVSGAGGSIDYEPLTYLNASNITTCITVDVDGVNLSLGANLYGNKSDTACITVNASNVSINCSTYYIQGIYSGPTKAIWVAFSRRLFPRA